MNYGFTPSIIDGTEYKFNASPSIQMPKEYSYQEHLPKVLNQGIFPICVPCSISAYVNWKEGIKEGEAKDVNVALGDIYNERKNKNVNGMSFKEALHYMKHHGVQTEKGLFKIDKYAMIGSESQLKNALLMNGPCIGGLPCYDSSLTEFWKQGRKFEGGHAISIVGYNEKGFIIRNSWGKSYGKNGYSILEYKDFSKFMEIWTLL